METKLAELTLHVDEGTRHLCGLLAAQLLLGHAKPESTVRYLGVEVDDALRISKQTEL